MRKTLSLFLAAAALVVGPVSAADASPIVVLEPPTTGWHWSAEPRYGSGVRVVWVIESTGNPVIAQAVRRFAAEATNQMLRRGTPLYLYASSRPAGPCVDAPQVLALCLDWEGVATFLNGWGGHIQSARAQLYPRPFVGWDTGTPRDPIVTWNYVCRQLGAGIGFAEWYPPTTDDGTCLYPNPGIPGHTAERVIRADQWDALAAVYRHPA